MPRFSRPALTKSHWPLDCRTDFVQSCKLSTSQSQLDNDLGQTSVRFAANSTSRVRFTSSFAETLDSIQSETNVFQNETQRGKEFQCASAQPTQAAQSTFAGLLSQKEAVSDSCANVDIGTDSNPNLSNAGNQARVSVTSPDDSSLSTKPLLDSYKSASYEPIPTRGDAPAPSSTPSDSNQGIDIASDRRTTAQTGGSQGEPIARKVQTSGSKAKATLAKSNKSVENTQEAETNSLEFANRVAMIETSDGSQSPTKEPVGPKSDQKDSTPTTAPNSSVQEEAIGRGLSSNVKPPASDLAFAVNIQSSSSGFDSDSNRSSSDSGPDPLPTEKVAVASAPAFPVAASASGMRDIEHQQSDQSKSSSSVPASGVQFESSSRFGTKPSDQGTNAVLTNSAALEDSVEMTQPKMVRIQVTGENDQRVDLRMLESSGAISISVRSADISLSKQLQQNVPELSSKLSDPQIRTEWWIPASKIEASPKSEIGFGDNNRNPGATNYQTNERGSSEQQDKPRPPDWVEELMETTTSQKNGRTYSWHL